MNLKPQPIGVTFDPISMITAPGFPATYGAILHATSMEDGKPVQILLAEGDKETVFDASMARIEKMHACMLVHMTKVGKATEPITAVEYIARKAFKAVMAAAAKLADSDDYGPMANAIEEVGFALATIGETVINRKALGDRPKPKEESPASGAKSGD